YPFFSGKCLQFPVFCAGIEDDATRFEGKNIIVIFPLVLRVQVKGDRIDIIDYFVLRCHIYIRHPCIFSANSYYRVSLAAKPLYGEITITGGVVRSAEYKSLFEIHESKLQKDFPQRRDMTELHHPFSLLSCWLLIISTQRNREHKA